MRTASLRLLGFQLLALASAATLAGAASADPRFPAELQKQFDMPCVPSCAVCHIDASGGPGRLKSLQGGLPGLGGVLEQNFGLSAFDPSTDSKAFADFKAGKPLPPAPQGLTDTDADGVTDVDELAAGTDPNDPDPGSNLCSSQPEYGCLRVGRHGRVDGLASAVSGAVIVIGASFLRRRRRRR